MPYIAGGRGGALIWYVCSHARGGEELACMWTALSHLLSCMQGVGAVVSGICLEGVISVNDVLLLGPMADGEFLPTAIKGIHRKRMPVQEVRGGQTASFALKKVVHACMCHVCACVVRMCVCVCVVLVSVCCVCMAC